MWNAILQFHFCKRKTSFESFFFFHILNRINPLYKKHGYDYDKKKYGNLLGKVSAC